MLQTRKQLKIEIERLRRELLSKENIKKENALINAAQLPKCQSIACISCKHIVFSEYGTLLGCGKDLSCTDYSPRAEDVPAERINGEKLLSLQRSLQQL